MDLPALFLPAGPMLRGHWGGTTLGSGSDTWKYWADLRAGKITEEDWRGIENGIARSPGHCMTMGTASTMAAIAEVLGLTMPAASSIPSVVTAHPRMASKAGRRIVEMVWEDLKPSDILTPASFDNAIRTDMAVSGSTNAIIHLIAMAGRAGVPLTMERFDELSQRPPVIANLRPAGKYLMQDFYHAGGLPALLNRIGSLLDLSCRTVSGKTLGEDIAGAKIFNDDVIRPLDNPVSKVGGTFVLRGNLSPNGCVIKPTAAEPRLLKHTGPAIVFRDYNHMNERLADPNLEITADHVMVMQSGGPQGAPGMPEWGMLPIPQKLLKQGVRDMVRISDARMSGTSYGTCVLHVSPESYVGGPIALVQDGDLIELDVAARKIQLHVSDAELAKRKAAWIAPPEKFDRGYGQLFSKHVTQAHLGCEFDFLERGQEAGEAEIH
jgi:dihydroxy-acid dehydratase